MLLEVPIIDLASFREGDRAARLRVATEVGRAINDIGFLVVTGHGVNPDLIAAVQDVSNAFFDLPMEEKLRDPYFTCTTAGKHFHPNLWPERPAALRPLYERYFRTMGALAGDLMAMFALALGLPEQFFRDKIDRHISRLRVRNYPAPTLPPKPGQLRAGAHSDYGSLTILRTEDKPGGLQVLNQANAWVDVPIRPDCFIVNIGELMARWTNERWRATLHRVVNPPAAEAAGSRRLSLVFFHNPNYDAPVAALHGTVAPGEAPKYPPTTSGDHLLNQFVRTQVIAGDARQS
jgi:isopenicillin N synthase-like dioxygenase